LIGESNCPALPCTNLSVEEPLQNNVPLYKTAQLS
jgi:hypothetical protein